MGYKSILIGLKSNKGVIKGWVQDFLDEIPKEVLKGYVLDVIRDYYATIEYGYTRDISKSTFKRIFTDKLFLYTDEGIYHLNDIEISQFVDIETFDGKINKLLFELYTTHYASLRIKLDKCYVINTQFNSIEKYIINEKYLLKELRIMTSDIPKEPIVFVLSDGNYIIKQNIDNWLSYIMDFVKNKEKNRYKEARKIKEIYLNYEKYCDFQRFFYDNIYYINHNHDGTLTLNYPYPINIRLNQKYHLTD